MAPRDRRGAAGTFRTIRRGDSVGVLPALAVPYLGRELDPALFDVTALAAAPAGRLPVRIAYRPGAAHRALPGVTVTSTSGDVATGYLTAGSARAFGEALAAQVRADAAAGWPRGAGLFAGVAAVRYGGAVRPAVEPRFPMVTLRIRVLDGQGQPAPFGSLIVLNVDNQLKYQGFPYVDNGEARVSVPVGNYSLLAEVPEFGADGSFTERIVNVSDFAVTAARTLTVDARTATSEVSVRTPRPAVEDEKEISWIRGDEEGFVFSASYGFSADTRVLVAPGRPAVHGELHWSNRWHLTAPDGSYTYDLKWGTDGAVPARQRFAVSAAQLATLTVHYYADVPDREINSVRFGLRAPDYFGFQSVLPVAAPSTRTEYVGGSPDVLWTQQITGVLYFDETSFIIADNWYDGLRSYRPGERVTVHWFRQPLHPSLDVDTGGDLPFLCPACRTGDTLGISVVPLSDSTPGHAGYLDSYGDTPIGTITAATRMRVWGGSTLLTDQRDVYGVDVEVPAAGQRYRVRYEQTRSAPWIRFGTRAVTEWGFRSARPATGAAPAHWICPQGTGECAVLPLLVPSYDVPVDQLGRVAPGPGTIRVALAPTQGAPASPVDTAGVQWSIDDGVAWTAAPVRSLGGGRFAADLPNPAGSTVSLRLTGRDRAGNTLTQTLIRAYAVR